METMEYPYLESVPINNFGAGMLDTRPATMLESVPPLSIVAIHINKLSLLGS